MHGATHSLPAPTLAEFLDGLELYREAILCGSAAGLVLGVLSVYVVLRRIVFVPLAVSHAAGLGVAFAFFVQIHLGAGAWASPLGFALAFALVATLLLVSSPTIARMGREALVGLIFIGASAAAILLSTRISQEGHELGSIIFGTAVMVSRSDFVATLSASAFVLGLHLWWRRGFICASFDPEGARVQGLPVRLLDTVLFATMGLMLSVATRALGAMPVFAFSVLPGVAALTTVRRFDGALVLGGAFGVVSALCGYVLAFFLQLPVGASQAAVATLIAVSPALIGMLFRRRP